MKFIKADANDIKIFSEHEHVINEIKRRKIKWLLELIYFTICFNVTRSSCCCCIRDNNTLTSFIFTDMDLMGISSRYLMVLINIH